MTSSQARRAAGGNRNAVIVDQARSNVARRRIGTLRRARESGAGHGDSDGDAGATRRSRPHHDTHYLDASASADAEFTYGVVGSVGRKLGVCRAWVACSNAYPMAINDGSLKAVPKNDIPIGSTPPLV